MESSHQKTVLLDLKQGLEALAQGGSYNASLGANGMMQVFINDKVGASAPTWYYAHWKQLEDLQKGLLSVPYFEEEEFGAVELHINVNEALEHVERALEPLADVKSLQQTLADFRPG